MPSNEPLARVRRTFMALAAALLLVAPELSSAVPPEGLLEAPRLAGFNINPTDPTNREAGTAANLERKFTFKGWVDFAPGQGELWIAVSCDGDSYPGNGTLRIKVAPPSNKTRIVDGRKVWTFSIGPFRPFRQAIVVGQQLGRFCGKPWQDGGTARVSVFAHRYSDGDRSELTYLDGDGLEIKFHDLIFADHNLTPVTQSQYNTPLYAVPPFLGKGNKTGTPSETEIYYQSVYVDENGVDTSRTILSELATLQAFKTRYFDNLSSCVSVNNLQVHRPPAIYFNKGDLGIGREMHCSYNDCTKETACFVKNFGKPDGSAHFSSDKTFAQQANDANKPFATVVMVSRGLMPIGAPNKVFFAVYGHQGRYGAGASPPLVQNTSPLATEAPLDNRAYNKFIPGNCLVCHGAAAIYNKTTRQVSNAYFLPFDVQHAFDYYSNNRSNPLSRAKQESLFKRLNQIISKTDLYTQLPDARALLNGFYGAPPADSAPNTWPSPTFKDDFVPQGWNVSGINDDTRQIYKKVVAPYCRTCHISDPLFHFGSWNDFVAFQFQIRERVCKARDQNIMPNAEATLNKFWRSDARAHFVSRLNGPGCGLEPYE